MMLLTGVTSSISQVLSGASASALFMSAWLSRGKHWGKHMLNCHYTWVLLWNQSLMPEVTDGMVEVHFLYSQNHRIPLPIWTDLLSLAPQSGFVTLCARKAPWHDPCFGSLLLHVQMFPLTVRFIEGASRTFWILEKGSGKLSMTSVLQHTCSKADRSFHKNEMPFTFK